MIVLGGCAAVVPTSIGVWIGQKSREELQELFAQAGEITEVVVPTDRMSGRPRGFAFVTFATAVGNCAVG